MQTVPGLVRRLLGTSPADVPLVLQRIRDHTLEERLSPEDTELLVNRLGFDSLAAFCAAVGLPHHIATRWERFGISSELSQVLAFMVEHRERLGEAVAEFEDCTNAGLDDFMKERGLL